MSTLSQKASTLLSLHVPGNPVILPTIWDAWSATVAAEAGFSGLTVGSHPLADSIGKADNEGMDFSDVVTNVKRITAAVELPVSVDIESGYGEDPTRLIDGLLEAGAVGLNIEDTVHSEGGRIREPQEHADLVEALRAAADAAGVHVVVNARTDLIMKEVGEAEGRVDRAIARLNLAASAGADVAYPVGFHSDEIVRQLTEQISLPVNAITGPGSGTKAGFASLGVARVSFGPLLQVALGERANELFASWK